MGELRISTIKTSKRRTNQIPTIVHVRTAIIVPCPGTHLEQTCCSSLCVIYCKGNPFLSDKTCKIQTKGYICYYQLYSECPAKYSFTFHCSVPLLLLTIYHKIYLCYCQFISCNKIALHSIFLSHYSCLR